MMHTEQSDLSAQYEQIEEVLKVREQLSAKHILITGVTGFVGKVLLTMVIARCPDVRKVSVLVRTNHRNPTARIRFDQDVMPSEPFKAIAKQIGEAKFNQWCAERILPLAGDVTLDRLGLSKEDYHHITKEDPLDLIIHCAGNVNFDPPLNQALEVNTLGVAHKLELAKAANCPLVHMSTCFVAGAKSGKISENTEVVGYSPCGAKFDVEREVAEALQLIDSIKARAKEQVMELKFKDEAESELNKSGLNEESEAHLTIALKEKRRRWVDAELKREGMERAKRWGWTNTYTYTKSMGEQLTLKRAKEMGVQVSIVRPAIVESAHSFPFPGWNEGVNTCAPIVYLFWKGHQFTPSNPENILDVIPVDWVCTGTLLACAELLEGKEKIYQFCTGDSNPIKMKRAIELTNLAWRKRYNRDFDFLQKHLLRNLDTVCVPQSTYDKISAPMVKSVAQVTQTVIKQLPKQVQGLFAPVSKTMSGLEKAASTADMILKIFAPFILDNNPCFSSANTRQAAKRLSSEEKALFDFPTETLDWRHYWMNVHMEGLQKWVFGELDDKMRKVRPVPRFTDLVALFDRSCREFKHLRAMKSFSDDGFEYSYTYGEIWENAKRIASSLKANGVKKGDCVVLLGENEPAWPMIYIGILLADATAVPVDPEMSDDSLMRIIRKSEAKVLVHHENYVKNTGDLPIIHLSISDAFKAEPLAENLIELRDRSNELASLLFTSGTTGDPKGVMLTHGNFCALVASLHGTFKVDQRDRFLSVLPLFHTFEFSCGFLLPISAGSQITYLGEIEGQRLRKAIQLFKPTVIIGVPALWDVLHKRIESQVKDKGLATEIAFKMSLKLNQQLRKQGMNAGNLLFGEIHRTLGGKIRHLISGGAALNEAVMNAFEGMGFDLLEGYGLTEAAPVLSVRRPNTQGTGTVGRPLPGVEIKIYQPNEGGVGEVIAKGDNVMKGYLKDDESTTATIKDGWLHTGDLGKIDKKGQLKLVGRRKEMIVTSSGKNVYPDELEPLFAEHDWIEELAIVGIPDVQGDEKVAALIVLKEGVPAEAQSAVKAHISKINAQRPDHQKLKTYRFWHGKLPRTSTRKVRRNEVKAELMRLLTLTSQGDETSSSSTSANAGTSANAVNSATSMGNHKSQYEPQWLYQNLALLLGLEISKLTPSAQLVSDLGISSLQMVELRLMIEENIQRPLLGEQFAKAQSIEDLVLLIAGKDDFEVQSETQDEKLAFWQDLPEVVQNLGQKAIDQGRKLIYDQLFDVDVLGKANIPYNEQLIVVSNHSSHLDVGLIKQALGRLGDQLCPLAAQDYFFSSEYKQAFFDQFTQLVPLDRTAPLEKSLQTAVDAIALGHSVLIYPEGTRSVDGQMQEFRPGVGYLQRRTKLAILPIYLRGPHRALPKGSVVPKSRKLLAKIGTPIWNHEIESWCAGKKDQEAYQLIANQLKIAIESLKEGKTYPWQQSTVKTQVNGVAGIFDELPGRFLQDRVDKDISWYFSIGEGNEGRYVLKVSKNGMSLTQGKGQADCVLKTDEKIFEKIVREGYVPQPAEFIQGKIKTNDPQLLFAFKHVFGL